MGRISSPKPSIIHLKLLMDVYTSIKNVPTAPDKISIRKLLERLSVLLKSDKVRVGTSFNLINKLRGFPYHAHPDDAEGIDPAVLDKLANVVLHHLNLAIPGHNDSHSDTDWGHFQNLVKIPDYLKKKMTVPYYKYLDDETKRLVDKYVERKISEFGLDSEDTLSYCLYYWNNERRDVITATFQLNLLKRWAILKYYERTSTRLITKSVQRTDTDKSAGDYIDGYNTFYLSLGSEDKGNAHLRTSLCLAMRSVEIRSLAFIKGTYATAIQNAERPVAGICLLEKRATFREALSVVEGKIPIDPKVYFELLNQRMNVNTGKILSEKQFQTYRIHETVKQIAGAYILGFFRKDVSDGLIMKKGICYIGANGKYIAEIEKGKPVDGYIHNDTYYDQDILFLSNFFDRERDNFKYQYTLEITMDKNFGRVLSGIYSGIYKHKPRVGKIVLVPQEGFTSFDDFKASDPLFDMVYVGEGRGLSPLDDFLFKKLYADGDFFVRNIDPSK